jgi:hypothetical protein
VEEAEVVAIAEGNLWASGREHRDDHASWEYRRFFSFYYFEKR